MDSESNPSLIPFNWSTNINLWNPTILPSLRSGTIARLRSHSPKYSINIEIKKEGAFEDQTDSSLSSPPNKIDFIKIGKNLFYILLWKKKNKFIIFFLNVLLYFFKENSSKTKGE